MRVTGGLLQIEAGRGFYNSRHELGIRNWKIPIGVLDIDVRKPESTNERQSANLACPSRYCERVE